MSMRLRRTLMHENGLPYRLSNLRLSAIFTLVTQRGAAEAQAVGLLIIEERRLTHAHFHTKAEGD
jgi:hypothetical protein